MVFRILGPEKRKLEGPTHLSGNRLVTVTLKAFLMTPKSRVSRSVWFRFSQEVISSLLLRLREEVSGLSGIRKGKRVLAVLFKHL